MLVDLTYEVQANIASLVRKPSRRFGEADHLTLAIGIAAGRESFVSVEVKMVMPA